MRLLLAYLKLFFSSIFKRDCRSKQFSKDFDLDALDLVSYQKYLELVSGEGLARAEGIDHSILPSYFYILCQPMLLELLASKHCRLRPAGLIHKSWKCKNILSYDPHQKSRVFAQLKDVSVDQYSYQIQCIFKIFQHETLVSEQESVFVKIRKRKSGKKQQSFENSDERIQTWSIDMKSLRSYASVSGDWNPIHLHRIFARLSGFSHVLVHGMLLVGKVLAQYHEAHTNKVALVQAHFYRPCFASEEVVLCNDGPIMENHQKYVLYCRSHQACVLEISGPRS
ncbi:MAG: hypothetical protein KDD52_08055 [Bdellovibrionales bacterium]|nr:hypothetical protein [Bdellovibrionales bacterium]